MNEARQPRFPMEIGAKTFELVTAHLTSLNYDGPVGLSCDDTKLFSSMRLYWDSIQQTHCLVGAVGGPLRLADPDQMREVMANPEVIKATKVRLWCLTIPVPKVTPIIVAAMPIPNNLDANTLLVYLESILDGLLKNNVKVISYACDGTEVERSIQRQLVSKAAQKLEYTIRNPWNGAPDLKIVIGTFCSQPIAMIQDSKHALKTFRNNLFSGAHALILGNYPALFSHIHEIAYEERSPIYICDVDKLDRQDDNAATRLFSADTLKFLTDKRLEYIGEIVFLFVFGELIDSYQNRSIPHVERVKMLLHARYFLDMWEVFLENAQYKRTKYFLSREATDIARIIIEGNLVLIFIHRDHIPGLYPLLPWLHSSEACEHVFGEARQIVKDFTMLDFFYIIPKLRVKVREAVLRAQSSDPKARANGYCHTYFDYQGIDLLALASYPNEADINIAAEQAAQEAKSLVHLLGLVPGQLRRLQSTPALAPLLRIGSWFIDDDNSDIEPDMDSEPGEDDAEELQGLLDQVEKVSLTNEQDDKVMHLTCAAVAVTTDEMIKVYILY